MVRGLRVRIVWWVGRPRDRWGRYLELQIGMELFGMNWMNCRCCRREDLDSAVGQIARWGMMLNREMRSHP